jgi:hypothetical protein
MPNEPANRAQRCMDFNDGVLKHLAASPHITYVVLSSRWQYLFTDPVFDARGQRVMPDVDVLSKSLATTVRRIRQMGKKVILISSPASMGPEVNLGLCVERRMLHLWTIMPSLDAQCGFSQRAHAARHAKVLSLLQTVGVDTRTEVIWLDRFTCPAGRCTALIDGVPLYRDADHLSHDGGHALGTRVDLGGLIAGRAR